MIQQAFFLRLDIPNCSLVIHYYEGLSSSCEDDPIDEEERDDSVWRGELVGSNSNRKQREETKNNESISNYIIQVVGYL